MLQILITCVLLLSLVLRPASRHFEPVELLLDLMERVVADLIVGAHCEDRLPRSLDGGAPMTVASELDRAIAVGRRWAGRQVCGKFLPDRLGRG
jgi:hypothetical protein